MESIDKDLLSLELKQKMSKWANKAGDGEIATVETIDYSKFYKIDKEKVNTANSFEGDLYLVEVDGDYKVISINGVTYQKEHINIIIPLDDIEEPKYITVGNNTYKWYGNGELSVIGELTTDSGMTSEENSNINGLQELNIKEIAKGTDMAFNNNVETEQNIAKVNGVKKIYVHLGTIYIIDANDKLWAWGANEYNKLGQGNSYLVTEPTNIQEKTEILKDAKVKNVWAGPTNTFILDEENRLWAAGANADGILGQGNTNSYNNFVEVIIDGLDNSTIEDIYLKEGNTTPYSSAIIKCSNGKVYAAGYNLYGSFGIGTTSSTSKFIEISKENEIWSKAKIVYNVGLTSYVITEEGELYGAGYNETGVLGLGHTNARVTTLTKIADNVKNITMTYESKMVFLKDNGYLYMTDTNGNINQLSGIQSEDIQFISNRIILSNKKMYEILTSGAITPIFPSYEADEYMYFGGQTIGFISNNKIYINGEPNITKPKEKSIYSLRNVFSGVQYVQGGTSLNIVDNDGNVYEGIKNRITSINDIKQVAYSTASRARYALKNDGTLYAKGNAYLWGNEIYKSDYTKVTKDGIEEFNNIDKIFAINYGHGLIFTTNNNEIYWAGRTTFVAIPGIQGDKPLVGGGYTTNYPKKVENELLNSIADKIKDIKFSSIIAAGMGGRNTLVLTTDGKLYSYSNNSNMTGVGATSDFTEIKFSNAVVEQVETLDGLTLAVLSNGEVYGWGYNTYGILGEGYELGGIYPTPVKLNLSNIRYISLGDGFAIFATHSGDVYGIGKNDYGQLGTGNNSGASTFVRCEELEK